MTTTKRTRKDKYCKFPMLRHYKFSLKRLRMMREYAVMLLETGQQEYSCLALKYAFCAVTGTELTDIPSYKKFDLCKAYAVSHGYTISTDDVNKNFNAAVAIKLCSLHPNDKRIAYRVSLLNHFFDILEANYY